MRSGIGTASASAAAMKNTAWRKQTASSPDIPFAFAVVGLHVLVLYWISIGYTTRWRCISDLFTEGRRPEGNKSLIHRPRVV